MYVAVKGGQKAIESAHALLADQRRGDPDCPELDLNQIRNQLGLAVDRVMAEGSVYDPELAALALKQAWGDTVEAVFLLRAYRTTLPRLAASEPLDTSQMAVRRRVSAVFKDLPGGQILGPTYDYTHRLLDFSLAAPRDGQSEFPAVDEEVAPTMPRVAAILEKEGLLETEPPDDPDQEAGDITRHPVSLPVGRDIRLQALARADEGFMLGLAYSIVRGFGAARHPFVGEVRMGEVGVTIVPEELGFPIEIADITVTECEMITQFHGSKDEPPQLTRGYGLSFGYNERRVMAMSLVDRSLRSDELGEEKIAPGQDEEFVLLHGDNVEAQGFVQHFKLPHYVDFQAELVLLRQLRAEALERLAAKRKDAEDD